MSRPGRPSRHHTIPDPAAPGRCKLCGRRAEFHRPTQKKEVRK